MAVHIYRNRDDEYVIQIGGMQKMTRVLLRRANRKLSFGGCVTSSPIRIWLACPRQVLGFANEDGQEDIHKGGFDQGPYAWDDYKGDYYELSALDIQLMEKLRRLMSEVDIEVVLECIARISDLLHHINWFSNKEFPPASLEECLTANDQVWLYLERISVTLSRYFLGVKEFVFD